MKLERSKLIKNQNFDHPNKGSKTDLEKVADYLKVAMNDEADFAEKVKGLATEIQSLKIQDNSSMNQTNYPGKRI